MITSSSIPYISQMLNDPHSITDADIDSIVSLTETYPYFVPARYMEAASQHKHQPFNADMMNTMQLYMGNWIVFHEYMQTAYGGEYTEQIKVTPYEEPADVDEDFTEEEETLEQPEDSFWSQDDEDEEEEIVTADEDESAVAIEAMEIEEELTAEEQEIEAEEDDEHYTEDEDDEYEESYLDEEEEEYEEEATNEEVVAADDDFFEEEETEQEYEEEPVVKAETDENLILPIYTEDYFLHQGIQVSNNIPVVDKAEHTAEIENTEATAPGLLMRVMSYAEWLNHFKTNGDKAREEEQDQKALKTMWQKEKLAAAQEEENEEIPENVFEMAVNSITKEDSMASEPLAEIYAKQGKYDAAIDMYKKLSLRNPQKSAYFARKVEEILKEK
jgi:hypothetical protein